MPVPETFQEIEFGMSNFDHSIDEGLESALVDEECFGLHAAQNFNGIVYYKDEQFCEDIWRFNSYRETRFADNLEELMENVNEEYGYE